MQIHSESKRILITGASRGIGRETAILLARGGHRVVLAARDEARLTALALEIQAEGGRAEPLPVDVTDDASVERAVRTLLAGGRCDVLVNNAGICRQAEFMQTSMEQQRDELELNYWGAVRLTRALLPTFIHQRSGHVVNVSSLLGSIASPTTANYCASKAALEAFSHALRGEVGRYGILVTVFVAPHTDTEMGRAVKFEGVVSLPVSYTARGLARAVERSSRKLAASPVYTVLLWFGRLFPAFMEARLAGSVRELLTASTAEAERAAD